MQRVIETAIALYIERSEFDAGEQCEVSAEELNRLAFPAPLHPWFGETETMRRICDMLSQEIGNDVQYETAVLRMRYPPAQ